VTSSSDPPRLALFVLRLLVRGEAREFIEGDLREEYHERLASDGDARGARWWFRREALSAGLSRVAGRRPASGRSTERGTRPLGGGGPRWKGNAILLDFRAALRALGRRPGFSLVVAGILAVGVGATTSVYSVADWLLLRPVPGIGAPQDRLVTVQASRPDGNSTGISYPNLVDLEAGAPAVEALAGTAPASAQVVGDRMEPTALRGEAVTEGYFDLLEVDAHVGRLFSPDELRPDGEDAVVVISHRMWTDELGSDPRAVGMQLVVNGESYAVIGVASEGFHGTSRTGDVDLWFPAARYPRLRHFQGEPDPMGRDRRLFMQSVARLAPSSTPEQAEQQLRDVMERLVAAYPEVNEIHGEYRPTVHPGIGVAPISRAYYRRIVTTMFAVAALLLLIACANVANLLVFRGARLEGAVAVRRALGASRVRIVREHLTEALILSTVAGVLAMGVASGLNEFLWRGGGTFGVSALDQAPLDHRVLLFTLATALSVPLAFALVPALLAGQTDVARSLQASRPTGTARRARLRGGLTVLQLSLSLALVVGSLLLHRTLEGLSRVDPGFDPEGLLVFSADPEPQGYSREEGVRLHLALLERAREIPGVQAATLARTEPFYRGNAYGWVRPPRGDAKAENVMVQFDWIGPDFFATLGVPMRRGRSFEMHEMEPSTPAATEVVVLNETLAQQLFGSPDVVGRTLTVEADFREWTEKRIVGVVQDVRDDLRSEPEPTLYLPFARGSLGTLLLRTSVAPEVVTTEVRAALGGIDPNVPLYRSDSVEEAIASGMAEERTLARLLGALALLAGGLAAVGLYAVVAWTVTERTREIGIRMAMGAQPGRVVAWVVRGAAWLALAGVGVGYGASILVARLLESRLFGVEPFDPATWGTAAVVMLGVATIASAQPALRAAAVRPMEALRSE